MSLIAAAIEAMRAKGMADSDILDVVAHMASAEVVTSPQRTARQERNARYYASQKRLKASESAISDGGDEETLPPPVSPLSPSPKPLTQNPPLSPTNTKLDAGDCALDGEILPPSPSPSEPEPGKARASPPLSTRGTRLPPDYRPTPSTVEWCRDNQRLTDEQFSDCLAEFRDYWSGVPGHRGLKCDWDGTFRNAVRKRLPSGGSRQAYASGNQRSDGSRLGAYQRAAAFVRAQNDVPPERGGVLDL